MGQTESYEQIIMMMMNDDHMIDSDPEFFRMVVITSHCCLTYW